MRRVGLLLALLWLAVPIEAADLCVNPSTGNDATAKASIDGSAQDGTGTCWATIGRAAWGSTDRSSPNTSEAAAAGDTVYVFGGTYTTSVAVNDRFGVVYNPANAGTAGNLITFTCVGTCVLGAASANAPVIGSNGQDYIKWYADWTAGYKWSIRAYGDTDNAAAATEVNTTADTGPVVCVGADHVWIEGAEIDGGLQLDYTDNWEGLRVEGCASFTGRNLKIYSFHNLADNANSKCVDLYHAPSYLIEHIDCTDAITGLSHKNSVSGTAETSGTLRYSKFYALYSCVSWSITEANEESDVQVYQNICDGSTYGVFVTGSTGTTNTRIYNNVFHDITGTVLGLGLYTGARFWNNVVHTAALVVNSESGTMPADTSLDLEHNDYAGLTNFYTGTDGTQSFAAFNTAHGDQNVASPVSITTDPLFVDENGGDFRLCTGSGTPVAGCSGASPAINQGVDLLDLDGDGSTVDTINAGACVTGDEVIGLESSGMSCATDAQEESPSAPVRLRITGAPE